jgi:hypothetical protein
MEIMKKGFEQITIAAKLSVVLIGSQVNIERSVAWNVGTKSALERTTAGLLNPYSAAQV